MYFNYSNNGLINYFNTGLDPFPLGTGSFPLAGTREGYDIIGNEMRDRLISSAGTGFLNWVHQFFQR